MCGQSGVFAQCDFLLWEYPACVGGRYCRAGYRFETECPSDVCQTKGRETGDSTSEPRLGAGFVKLPVSDICTGTVDFMRRAVEL